jgi:hypothetical protein
MNQSTSSPGGPDRILELRVVLADIQPEIWRQLEVRSSCRLSQLHHVLQVAFGWEDIHLHKFAATHPYARLRTVNGEIIEEPQWMPAEWCEEPFELAEEDCTVDRLLDAGAGTAFYEYDFGDSWLHRIELLSHRAAGTDDPAARLIAGARRGPLEDSGGVPGYYELVEALADPSRPGYAEQQQWVAEMTGSADPYDPDFLDTAAVNSKLSSLPAGPGAPL